MTFVFLLIPGILYSGFLVFLALGYFRHPKPQKKNTFQKISVIVAARNEEDNLEHLLQCLTSQEYPVKSYEIIIVDDRSTDATPILLAKNLHNVSNLKIARIDTENTTLIGKKNALDTGIRMASYDILAFTDADCSPGRRWLNEIDRHLTPETDLLIGYSALQIYGRPLPALLKNFERAVYAAIANGSFGWKFGITCTATNFVYRKPLFDKVGGFASIGTVRSGDDDLMMLKMMPYVRKINYMITPDSFVSSKYSLHLDSHMALETRRASKFKYYPFYLKSIAFMIFAFYLYFYTTIVLSLTGHFPWDAFLVMLLIKTFGELCLVIPFLLLIRHFMLFLAYPILTVYYPFHFLFFALKGTFGSYKWK